MTIPTSNQNFTVTVYTSHDAKLMEKQLSEITSVSLHFTLKYNDDGVTQRPRLYETKSTPCPVIMWQCSNEEICYPADISVIEIIKRNICAFRCISEQNIRVTFIGVSQLTFTISPYFPNT